MRRAARILALSLALAGPALAARAATAAAARAAGAVPAAGATAPAAAATAARPEPCKNTETFEHWLTGFRTEAAARGISPATIASELRGVTVDPAVLARDRRQDFFWQTFLEFSARLATQDRIVNGRKRIVAQQATFERIDREYGVPAPVIAAFWALESDFGLAMGKFQVLRSLATLAWDCRRGPLFRTELLEALKIIERGDLTPATMIGSWAGELGQTQFLPSHYFRHAVDYDGDGRRDLLHCTPDLLGSTAAFLASLGWQRGQPWLVEVQVPAHMAWEEADLTVVHARAWWQSAGVLLPGGAPLAVADLPCSLLLPMGRNGPAFLAFPNFQVYLKWNQSLNYALTAAYLAQRIAGAPALRRGNAAVPALTGEQLKQLQTLLLAHGYPVGPVDGKLGAGTSAAVRAAQLKLGLPPDAYPTPDLLGRLTAR